MHERPPAVTRGGVFLDDVGSRDIGRHQVRRELNALELQPEGRGNRAHHEGLRRARQTGDQAVTADEQGDQYLLDDLVLADDDLANLAQDAVTHGVETVDPLLQVTRIHLRWGRIRVD